MNRNDNTPANTLREMTRTSSNRHNPFKVPEGYFDALPHRVMQRIQAEKRPVLQRTRKDKSLLFIRFAVAAMLAGVFFMAGVAIYNRSTPFYTNTEDFIFAHEIEYNDELLDYAMLDNSDIELYLTAAE